MREFKKRIQTFLLIPACLRMSLAVSGFEQFEWNRKNFAVNQTFLIFMTTLPLTVKIAPVGNENLSDSFVKSDGHSSGNSEVLYLKKLKGHSLSIFDESKLNSHINRNILSDFEKFFIAFSVSIQMQLLTTRSPYSVSITGDINSECVVSFHDSPFL